MNTAEEAKRLYDIYRAAGFPENSGLVPTEAQWKALLEIDHDGPIYLHSASKVKAHVSLEAASKEKNAYSIANARLFKKLSIKIHSGIGGPFLASWIGHEERWDDIWELIGIVY